VPVLGGDHGDEPPRFRHQLRASGMTQQPGRPQAL
jgi:hypothetical protein